VVKRILDGRPKIPLAYRGTSRFHTTSVANIAALVRTALEMPGTRVLNIGDPDAPSVAEIASAIAPHLRFEGTIVNGSDGDNPPMIGSTPYLHGPRADFSPRAAIVCRYGVAPAPLNPQAGSA
jgi:nucleoside-diphosphate-sugar epimerase